MDIKTRRETLISLRNDQLEVVINREASVRMLKDMDPKQVLTMKMDMHTMQPETITVEKRLKEMEEGLVLDQARLDAFDQMIDETTGGGVTSSSTG